MVNSLKVKSFRWLLYMYLGIFVTMDLISMVEAYFLTYIVEAPEILSYILGILLLFEVLTMPLATLITNRTSKVQVIIWGSIAWALACLANLFITPATPHGVLYAIAAAIGVAIAFPLSGSSACLETSPMWRALLRHPQRGQLFGVQQFTRKCASAVANGVTLGVIGLVGFINPIEEIRNGVAVLITQVQPDIVLGVIRSFMSFTAVLLLIPTVVVALLWQLTPERHARMIDYLDKKRAGLAVDKEIEAEMQHLRENVL